MRKTHSKKSRSNRLITTLSVLLIVLLTVVAVAIAAYWYRPQPGAQPQNSNSGSNTHVTDTDTNVSSTETITDVVTDTDSGSSETTSTTTDTGNTTDTQVNITTNIPRPDDGTTKKVAFTFDDGPHYIYTKQIADLFAEYGGKCTYFVVGNRISGSNAAAMGYAASLGHEVGSHAYTHEVYFGDACSEEAYQTEMQSAHDAILGALGYAPTLMRPPGGTITKTRIANSIYSVILWNVDSYDWKNKKVTEDNANVDIIVNNVLSKVSEGDIVLMHDLYQNTVEAVRILLPILKEQGYEFVTVSELLGEYKAPGKRYSNAY